MKPEFQIDSPEPQSNPYTVPWRPRDTWLGIVLLIVISILLLLFVARNQDQNTSLAQSVFVVLLEMIYVLPVVLILAWRRIPWSALGFGGFRASTMGLGCGLLIGAYLLIIIHNVILNYFGVDTQGEEIIDLFQKLDAPAWFLFVGIVVAPLVEEIFFRGFLFQGFRAHYGWVAGMLMSSAVFAAAHLDPVALIPTFILGNVLAYLYHRSNSIWPGVILHLLVNAMGLLGAYFINQYPNLIPG